MQLNGKQIVTEYGIEYVDREEKVNVLVQGDFSNGNYIDLGIEGAGGEGSIRFLVRGTTEQQCWERFYRFLKDMRKGTIINEGFTYDIVGGNGHMEYIGRDITFGGVFGIASIPVILTNCYSAKVTVPNPASFVPTGAIEPYVKFSLTNSAATARTFTITGFEKSFIVGPIPAGKTIVVDGLLKKITIDGVNRIDLFQGYSFPILVPGKQTAISISPSTTITRVVEYWPRWY